VNEHQRPAHATDPTVGETGLDPLLGAADVHIHPFGNDARHGQGLDPSRAITFLDAIAASGLQLAALTDHDDLDNARQLIVIGRDRGLALVLGVEVTTGEGHLLGLGLDRPILTRRALGDSIADIHDQGGVAIVAHPLLFGPISASAAVLARLADGEPLRRPDALEGFNPGAAWLPRYEPRVREFAARHAYPVVGGSDAHRPSAVGRGRTRFAGSTFDDLRAAIAAGRVSAEGRPYGLRDALVGFAIRVRASSRRPVVGAVPVPEPESTPSPPDNR
jgi:predicted metal-dependent phosphoesterase TrpH